MQKHLLALAAGVATFAFSTAAFAESNNSYTRQEGNRNSLEVNQQGSNNLAGLAADQVIYQQNDSQSVGNSLFINQTGSSNRVGQSYNYPDGSSSVIDANQTGSNNSLRIDQTGTLNSVAYRQFGNNNGTRPAEGAPVGDRRFMPEDNYGRSSGNQSNTWNYISQTGYGGNVRLDQDSRGATGGSNGVITFQSGPEGYQFINLKQATTGSADNLAYLDQRESNRGVYANINQTNTGASYNLTDVRQRGSNLTVNGTQTGSGLDLFVQQRGDGDTVSSTQTANDSQVRVLQTNTGGAANTVTAFQTDGSGHLLNVIQTGNGHQVTSTQGGAGQIAIVDQNGSFNTYTGTQTGASNYASVLQGATLNNAVVTQNGTSNSALITQNRTR